MSVPEGNRRKSQGKSTALPLTIGVELELILCTARKEYTSPEFAWLHAPGESPEDENEWSSMERTFRYTPQLMWASRILKCRGLDHVVEGNKHTEVQKWGLVPEISAKIDGWEEVSKHLPDRVYENTLAQWDAAGVELVSRILQAPNYTDSQVLHSDPALVEIRKYVEALLGTSQTPWGAYTNASCGLHVHVGLDPNLSQAGLLPLAVLQHLSYMLLQFETSISALHPRGRRALADTMYTTGCMLGSNSMGLRQSRHVCDKVPLPLLKSIRDRIFSEDMTIDKLASLMSETARNVPYPEPSRFKFVNFFRPLDHKNPAKTIEFRQHDGSMDAEEIGRWVLFVTRLVRAAERLATESKPASPVSCSKQSDEYDRLFNLMDMPQPEREYWIQKYTLYNPEEAYFEAEVASISTTDCPECADEAYVPVWNNKTNSSSENSPVLPYSPRLPSTPTVPIPLEEAERLRTVWGIYRSEHTEGESGDEGVEDEPSSRWSNGDTTHEDFFW